MYSTVPGTVWSLDSGLWTTGLDCSGLGTPSMLGVRHSHRTDNGHPQSRVTGYSDIRQD